MARQPWSDAWVSRMEHRTRAQRGQSERERAIAEHRDFLLVAPISTVVGFEREHVFYNLYRDVAVLSCGHTQSVWGDGRVRCYACYLEIVAHRAENWLEA